MSTNSIANEINNVFTEERCRFLLTRNFHALWNSLSFNFATDSKFCEITKIADDQFMVEIYQEAPMLLLKRSNVKLEDVFYAVQYQKLGKPVR